MSEFPLLSRLPDTDDPDGILEGFFDYLESTGIDPYPAQEEAILELLSGNNVILATPTGSGKSLVATAAHFAGLAGGRRSFYTAPIKALVSEKFFALCRDFGTDAVGMITGDGSVNPGAPIICCTAEILANMALREGAESNVDIVIVDEFHFYSEPQRGWAWQIPLLELPNCQFLLMSATLGETDRFESGLEELTGRPTTLVKTSERPVPLRFAYRETSLLESVEDLIDADRAPIYIVYFTQRDATEAAQNFMSINVLTKQEKAAVKAEIGGFRFDSPIGKDLKRFVNHGVGVHHAGLLPKYRLLVERLAQKGLLKLICGTDTLGVGVNVPIRSVLLSQLCKYDGIRTRTLKVREFQQIAGRAGRKGFDDVGDVWAQAPAHMVENIKAEKKAENDPKKKKKLVKKKPPERGYTHWGEDTFTKLIHGDPESLDSSFDVSHHMLMNVLDRPGDGCAAMKHILLTNHEPRKRQRAHIRRAISIYRSLVDAEVVEQLTEPDDMGRTVRVTIDLQDDFALTQPLSLFAVEAIDALEQEAPDYELNVLSVVEAVIESPGVIMAAQLNQLRGELVTELKSAGVEYDERMEKLDALEAPKPLADFLYPAFDIFREHHPWVGHDNVRPKSIARELWERAMTFSEYVQHYGLKRSEGVLLRYLGDAYKGLVQNVPEDAKTDELYDLTDWLGEVVRQVDSSLLDEWDRLTNPTDDPQAPALPERRDVTQTHAFRTMVRNEAFRWVQLLARRRTSSLADISNLSSEEIAEQWAGYFDEHEEVISGPEARGPQHFGYDAATGVVTQTIVDPDEWLEWKVTGKVDFDASRSEGNAVVEFIGVAPLRRA
ncbi:MAG: superfamily II RNA helicase [Acidimicrobiales bacterium]|jgi:superfamily II RNA helicase